MLEKIRSRSSGIFAWFIAIVIIVTMALFGVSSYVSEGVDPIIYEYDGEKILQSQYRGTLQQAQSRALSQNSAINVSSEQFKINVLRQIINQTLVRALSQDAGYIAADKSVANLILENPSFQADGKFDVETYNLFVSGNFGSKQNYEQLLKNSVVSSQFVSGLINSTIEIPGRKNEILSLASEKREFDIVNYSVDDLIKSVIVSDEQVAEHFESTKSLYQDSEKLSVDYITLNAKTFEEGIELTDDDLRAIFEQEKETYTSPETRELSHILFTGSDSQSQAMKALTDIYDGASFEDLAKELSQDPGSSENGGSLGDVSKGDMVQAFEDVAFSLELNKVSEPVSTEFGYHLIKVTAINGGVVQDFDSIKESLKTSEITRQAEDAFFTQAESLRNAVFENADTLQVAAEDLGLTVETSDFFTRNKGEGYFNNPSIRTSAFSDTVLLENQNSEVLEVSPSELLVLRKNIYAEQKTKPLESVKDQVVLSLKRELAIKKIEEKLESDYKSVVESDNWGKSMIELNLTSTPNSMTYLDQSNGLPSSIAPILFSTSDTNYKASISKVVDASGNAYLFKLNSITEGSPSELDKETIDLIDNDLAARNSSSLAQNYIAIKLEKAMNNIDLSLL